jgi:HTH-type transcriptional regulator / antitoxin HigA
MEEKMNEISPKPIKTEADYAKALSAVDRIFHAEEGTPEAHLRDQLCKLIEDYEDKHYPIDLPTQ